MVDTSVWSHYLRRHRFNPDDPYVQALLAHTRADDAVLTIGVILEEILSGVRSDKDFDWVLRVMSRVPMIPLGRETYVSAARLRNRCRTQGVQATTVDCLIAATCIERGYPLLTADRDFVHIAEHSELILLPPLG